MSLRCRVDTYLQKCSITFKKTKMRYSGRQPKKISGMQIRIRIGSGLDPDSIRSVDPDPDSESGSGSRRAKMTHKRRKKCKSSCFEVLDGLF
jgi:hypothetical protein